ncbi:hypothetical protein Curi_c14550 [Gottschalkia acidurici 9a]|uniref:Uncharacterized protein n=1 Tax=Gottschalkia acidurici (strain ATCC 7906 / DSM 604 / BCRC 14475 / CIP 104303 / KCTC 5404 / NCIMB 10678 / 9a) TaxID=1128398 RepID=K0B0N1_GOTA9|nr:hypothetical protein [Gottschalkia acidurici]AFS78465.1 hypothetical protein Curi_c14550 [Gottschalkia acidurici 9a]
MTDKEENLEDHMKEYIYIYIYIVLSLAENEGTIECFKNNKGQLYLENTIQDRLKVY